MEKKKISKYRYKIIKEELDYQINRGFISEEVKGNILNSYEIAKRFNFIQTILIVAAVLIGAGILSFIASNWAYMSKPSKFLTIIFFIGVCNFGGLKLENIYPRVSRSLIYLGLIIYGAGIFLVGQMFHYSSDFGSAFLIWSVGVFPIALVLKDRILFSFGEALIFIYIYLLTKGKFEFLIISIGILAILYLLNKRIQKSHDIIFFNIAILLTVIMKSLILFEVEPLFIAIIFFIIGLSMSLTKLKKELMVNSIGILVYGIAGIILTISELWEFTFSNLGFFSFIFAIGYFIFLIYLLNKGEVYPIILICILIFRYYIDLSFDFMPKSLFFIGGGLILGGFGYWFEKKRKEGRDKFDKK
ncbi:DUF2157 domain-containing protein [Defluviitalea phaphyphila]|uniref:DUF2157 domain-containing protein n=1 Tax=Defluviitalea phaphyphila TaxID=1473580 RepID=UPI0007316ABF|nr:DUF2157 domain-containing protein [Defluviitalea phaphyphila]